MFPPGIVILGAGQAGAWAARTLRDSGYQDSIYLVGDESYPPYERPELSKRFLLGEMEHHELMILDDEDLSSINLLLGVKANHINKSEKTVSLSNGQVLKYTKLLFATGGRANIPSIPGINLPGVHTLRTIEDAKNLAIKLKKRASQCIAIIGGGWIGLEMASTCRKLGRDVSIFEASDRLCKRSVDHLISNRLEELHISNDNKIFYNKELIRINEKNEALELCFSDGQYFIADNVLIAAGLKANDELAINTGLVTRNGIVVNSYSQTSDPDIYAAGDVAILPCFFNDLGRRHESWQNAQDQGVAVAKSMLGDLIIYEPKPMLWSDQFDTRVQLYGYVHEAEQRISRLDESGNGLYFYLGKNDKVIGVIAWNNSRDFRFARQLVDLSIPISRVLLEDINYPLVKIIRDNK